MRNTSKLLLGAAAVALLSAPVLAADPPGMDIPDPDSAMTSGWDGLYVGVQSGYDFDGYVPFQGVLGVNMTAAESFLIGVEAAIGPYFDVGGGGGNGYEGYLAGRVGFLADPALFYVLGGADIVDGSVDWIVGAGAEFMVSDNLSFRAQLLNYDNDFLQGTIGLMWHIN